MNRTTFIPAVLIVFVACMSGACAKDKGESYWSKERLEKQRKKEMDDMQKQFDDMNEQIEFDRA